MTTGPSSDGEPPGRERQSTRLALFRALLAIAYLAAEAYFSKTGLTKTPAVAAGLFLGYSILLLLYHSHHLAGALRTSILFLDLIFLLSLLFWGSTAISAVVAAIFYAFLVLEGWSLPGGREVVLLATALVLVVYGAGVGPGRVAPLAVTAQSVLFLLVVGGLLTFVLSDRRCLAERRILAIAHRTTGASDAATIAAIQDALKELVRGFRCSHALLAFWDERNEHFCVCRYPPAEDASRAPGGGSPGLEDSREWSILYGERLTFLAKNIPRAEAGADSSGAESATSRDHEEAAAAPPAAPPGPEAGDHGLHPLLIRKFHIYNAMGCALHHDGQVMGRLLLINSLSRLRPSSLQRLERVAPPFAELARHVLVIKAVEDTARQRERERVAQDFHDGPLQSVISFQMRVHTIRKLLDRDAAAATRELEQLQELARKQVTEMRTFVNSMRPVEVDTANLTAAARRLVDDFQKESGVPVTFVSGDEPVSTSGKIGVDVLQIIREALHNIHKHAHASHVVFSFEESDNHLLIAVNDNGKGFRFGGKYSLDELESLRLGPNSIKQRTRALGGQLLLESNPGNGTSLRLKIPLY